MTEESNNNEKEGFKNANYAWRIPLVGLILAIFINMTVKSMGAAGFVLWAVCILIGIGYTIAAYMKSATTPGVLRHAVGGTIVNISFIVLIAWLMQTLAVLAGHM